MDEITTTIKKDNENIDDVLYLIKQNKFNVEILKKEHGIDINVITYYNENRAVIEYKKNKYHVLRKKQEGLPLGMIINQQQNSYTILII